MTQEDIGRGVENFIKQHGDSALGLSIDGLRNIRDHDSKEFEVQLEFVFTLWRRFEEHGQGLLQVELSKSINWHRENDIEVFAQCLCCKRIRKLHGASEKLLPGQGEDGSHCVPLSKLKLLCPTSDCDRCGQKNCGSTDFGFNGYHPA